jgi:hypothetical protein
MVVAISEKRCGFYMHLSEKNDYNEALEAFFYITHEFQNPHTSKNRTLGGETPKVMSAPMGKLVPQLLDVVTFAYDLCFRHVIAHWKGI